jgi:hypothetical protein
VRPEPSVPQQKRDEAHSLIRSEKGGIIVSNRKRIASIAFTGAAAAAAVGMNLTPAAAAAGTWKTSPGNGTTFTGHNVNSATLSADQVAFTCKPGAASTTGQVSGSGKPYSPPTATQLGTITTANFGVGNNNCQLFGSPLSAFTTGVNSYQLNGKTYHSSTGVTSGSLTGISARINTKSTDAISCHLTVTNIGTGSPLPGSFNNASHEFHINPGNTTKALRIKSVSGSTTFCTNIFHPGDPAAFSATYSTNPALTVTAGS